jgi:hypothetical protein
MSDKMTMDRRFDEHFAVARGRGIKDTSRDEYRRFWDANSHMHATSEDSLIEAGITLQRYWAAPDPAPSPKPVVATFEMPSGLDAEGQRLHGEVQAYASAHDVDFTLALGRVTGNDELEAEAPARFDGIHDDVAGIGSTTALAVAQAAELDSRYRQLAAAENISYRDAADIAKLDDLIADARADDGRSDVPWKDTSRDVRPRPWSNEDWERDRRRADSVGLFLHRDEWEAVANEGTDLVYEHARRRRAERLQNLEARRDADLRAAQAGEAEKRRRLIEAELRRRAEERLAALDANPRARPKGH